ncbi:helix-turn-helix domain-containing protein [Mycobacterium asiaticum]|nr:helix-turn-helix transcriptional regulator [Mycobacterium asiaticum]
MMHEYRRFIQAELDARGWKPADLVRRSKLRRQLIWKILHDDRDHLGQMPDDTTLEAIADGFGIPVDRVRTAAARSLVGYTDDGRPVATDLEAVPTDVLIEELRRRTSWRGLKPNLEEDPL